MLTPPQFPQIPSRCPGTRLSPFAPGSAAKPQPFPPLAPPVSTTVTYSFSA